MTARTSAPTCPACALAARETEVGRYYDPADFAALYIEAYAHGFTIGYGNVSSPWVDAHELCKPHAAAAEARSAEMSR